MSFDWGIIFGAIALLSTVLNGFVLIRINPLINSQNLLKQALDNLYLRVIVLETASNKSQENHTKLAVIEEHQKTTDVKIDRIGEKVDILIERRGNK